MASFIDLLTTLGVDRINSRPDRGDYGGEPGNKEDLKLQDSSQTATRADMRGHILFRTHAKRWLMPAILLVGFVVIIVWVLYKFRRYRQKMGEQQGNLDTLYGRASRKLGEDE